MYSRCQNTDDGYEDLDLNQKLKAVQYQSLSARNHQKNTLKTGVDYKCSFYDKFTETIGHIDSVCSILAPTEYKNSHDRVSQYLYWKICNHYQLSILTNWFEHHPQSIAEGENLSILLDSIYTPIKLFKQTNQTMQIGRMWNLKETRIPVIVGALGMIKKGCQKYFDKIPGQPQLQKIQERKAL